MILASARRLKNEEDITAEDRKKPASEQPIACSKQDEEKLLQALGISVGVGAIVAGVAGGVVMSMIGGPLGVIAAIAALSAGVAGGYAGYKLAKR